MFDKDELRELIEMAYHYAWGPAGNTDLRDSVRYLNRVANVGYFLYTGEKFLWFDTQEESDNYVPKDN